MLFEIQKEYHRLRKSEKKVADVILEQRISLDHMTITELATEAGVSQPTVQRFAQAMGKTGFRELKVGLLRDESLEQASRSKRNQIYGHSITPEDKVEEIPAKTIYSTIKLLEETIKAIDVKAFATAVEAIVKARSIVLYGVENSTSTISDLETKLLYLGLNCRSYKDSYLQLVSARHLGKGDVAVGISYSGNSRDTVDTLKLAREAGACTIAVTNFRDSLLSKYADILICTGNTQLMCGEAIFSRTTQMTVNDMLYTGILASDFEVYADQIEKSSDVIENRAYLDR